MVRIWTPLAFERIVARCPWTSSIYFLWPVAVLTALIALMAWRWLEEGREVLPFRVVYWIFRGKVREGAGDH